MQKSVIDNKEVLNTPFFTQNKKMTHISVQRGEKREKYKFSISFERNFFKGWLTAFSTAKGGFLSEENIFCLQLFFQSQYSETNMKLAAIKRFSAALAAAARHPWIILYIKLSSMTA